MKRFYIYKVLIVSGLLLFAVSGIVFAGLEDWQNQVEQAAGVEGKGVYVVGQTENTSQLIARYIGSFSFFLTTLGLVLLIRIIWGGYLWMTAGGKTEQIDGAKKAIWHATLGIVLTSALYILSYFLIQALSDVTGYKNF